MFKYQLKESYEMIIAQPIFEGKVRHHRNQMNLQRAQKLKERLPTLAAKEKLDLGQPAYRWTLWLWHGEEAHSPIELGGFGASLQELFAFVAQRRPDILQQFERAIILESRGASDLRVNEYVCFEG